MQQQQPLAITDDQIYQYSGLLKAAFEQQSTPQELAEHLIQQAGPMIGQIVQGVNPDRVIAVLSDREPEHALLRRDGQKFLRDTWALLARA